MQVNDEVRILEGEFSGQTGFIRVELPGESTWFLVEIAGVDTIGYDIREIELI